VIRLVLVKLAACRLVPKMLERHGHFLSTHSSCCGLNHYVTFYMDNTTGMAEELYKVLGK